MAQVLVGSQPRKRRRPNPERRRRVSSTRKSRRVDAATLASNLQLQEERRELIYSFMALAMKFGLFTIAAGSLFKLGFASHQRVVRHAELSSILQVESVKLTNLQARFDHLFTIGGDRRLMDEQDQWIAPNHVRVIWR